MNSHTAYRAEYIYNINMSTMKTRMDLSALQEGGEPENNDVVSRETSRLGERIQTKH